MRWTTLDEMVSNVLLQRGKSIHWYLQYLTYACNCLRELHFDTLRVVNTEKLLLNSYYAVTIPCDYVDFVRIGVPNGQFVQPLVNRPGINRLNNREDGGGKIPYGSANDDSDMIYNVLPGNHTTSGESIGRYFGFQARMISDGYKIVKERNEIQFDENIGTNYIILEYISDGNHADAATKITPYAQATIDAYIKWQEKENSRTYGEMEKERAKQEFENQSRKLRARMSDLTLDDIKRVMRTHGSIKA